MLTTTTLTSLAILKVNVDQGIDYLDYLRPFILQVLVEHRPEPVTSSIVKDHIRNQYDLDIPERTVEIVLKRISRVHPLKKEYGVYQIKGDLPNPQIAIKKKEAEKHIMAVVSGLQQFSQNTTKPISNPEDAVSAIKTFLTGFDVICLRAYLQGTTIPQLNGAHQSDVILVSDYVQHMQWADTKRFNSFLVLVQGHMLANALLCPDLGNIPQNYRGVTFYLDTPLLVHRLGVEGEAKKAAMCELIDLLNKLGGKISVFSHSREELQTVLDGAAAYVDSTKGRGPIISEARRRGTTKSDLLIIAGSVEEKLSEAGINIEDTPRYKIDFQIDEVVFEHLLSDEISYRSPRALEYDINSVRSVYAIRANKLALSIEKAKAVFVTSNVPFAKTAWEYGQQHESSRAVSTVITAFSLANMAWLKVPMGASSIPRTQVLAIAYAALEPSSNLLEKYLTEIDRLEKKGDITERNHQLLRSSLAYDELMHLTLGEDSALTEETITQTLERVSNEIIKEESEKLNIEKDKHQNTQNALDTQRAHNQEIKNKIFWRCHSRARFWANISSAVLGAVLVVGLSAGLGLSSADPLLSWGLIGGSIVVALLTLVNFIFGSNVRSLHNWVQNRYLTWLLKREKKAFGINLTEFDM